MSETEKITLEKIEKLINEKNIEDFKDLMNASIEGDKEKLNKLIGSYNLSDDNLFFVCKSDRTKALKNKTNEVFTKKTNNVDQILNDLKPKVFWKDKNSYIKQFNKWKDKDLNVIIGDLNNIELSLKSKSQINKNILFKMFLVKTCGAAST